MIKCVAFFVQGLDLSVVCVCVRVRVCERERGVGSNLVDWTGWGSKSFVHYHGWSGLKESTARNGEITCETTRLTTRH